MSNQWSSGDTMSSGWYRLKHLYTGTSTVMTAVQAYAATHLRPTRYHHQVNTTVHNCVVFKQKNSAVHSVEVCVLYSHLATAIKILILSGFLTLLISISWRTHYLVWWPIIATCVPKHEKLTETVLNVLVFRHMMLCQLVNSWEHSEETGCLHLQGIYHLSWTTITMGEANSSNTSVTI